MTLQKARGATKIIKLDRNSEGTITEIHEEVMAPKYPQLNTEMFEMLREVKGANGQTYRLPLKEAVLSNPDAANILRRDIRKVAFDAFNANPRTFEGFTDVMPSNMPEEEYLRDAAIGVIPKANSGDEAPQLHSAFEGGKIIGNDLYRGIVSFKMDWFRFDQLGKIRQLAMELGLSGRMTEEDAVYSYITTTTNYGRNSTTGDNDYGANQQTLTWNADSLRTALAIISTAKDRKSGAYLGYNADTVIIGPLMQVPVIQLLRESQLSRAGVSTAAEVIGTGAVNPLAGIIGTIIVSPWFDSSYGWAICDSTRNTFKFQQVEAFNVFQQTQIADNESWFRYDKLEYLVKGYFGVGMVDDRAWFYSDSSTDATVS